MFETGPFTRQRGGECGSVSVRSRTDSGRVRLRHPCAKPMKSRCSGVKPSIFGGLGFPSRDCSYAY